MILGTFFNKQLNNQTDRLISRTYNGYYENQSVDFIGWRAFGYNTNLAGVSLPNVSSLGYAPFIGCTGLLSAYIPNCTYVSEGAFSGCTNLKSVILPWSSITSIKQNAFYNCQKLPFSISNNNLVSVDYATFRSCYLLTEISLPVCVQLAGEAFFACQNLSEVYLPCLANISGASPFYQCSKLSCIDFPLLTYIQQTAFQQCINALYIKLPNATTIGNSAMANCSKVSYAYIGGAGTISTNAFGNCWTLLSLYLLGSTMRTLGNVNVFNSTPISTYTTQTGGVQGSIFVPESLYSSYIAATNWVNYSARFVSLTDVEILALTGSWVSTITASFTYPQSKAIYVSDGTDYLKSNCLSVTQTLYNGTSSVLSANDYVVTLPTISAGYNSRYAVKEQRGIFRFIATIDAELPEEYERVGYLQTSGTQYLDIEILPEQSDQFAFSYAVNGARNANGTSYLLGASTSHGIRQSANYWELFWAGTRISYAYFTANDGVVGNIPTGTQNIFTTYPNAVATTTTASQTATNIPRYSYYVGAANNSGVPSFGENALRIWYVEILNRIKLIPCKRKSDNVLGMYDLMGNICSLTNTPFFINAGTGSFTYGYNP